MYYIRNNLEKHKKAILFSFFAANALLGHFDVLPNREIGFRVIGEIQTYIYISKYITLYELTEKRKRSILCELFMTSQ